MELIVKRKGDACILAPDGIMDAQGGEKLLETLREQGTQIKSVILDGVLWFGVTGEGLDALAQARESLDSGISLQLRNINTEIMEILELTELIYGFEILDTPI
jgi:anti-anti-sigma regulatory factor